MLEASGSLFWESMSHIFLEVRYFVLFVSKFHTACGRSMLHWMPSKSPHGGGQLKEQFNRSTFQKTLKSIRHRNCGTRAIPGFWGMPLQMIQMLVSIATRLVWVVRRLSRSPTAECVCAWGYDILPYPVAQALEDGRHKVCWSLQIFADEVSKRLLFLVCLRYFPPLRSLHVFA